MAPPDALPAAAIANRISMLIAAQSSILATLSPSTATTTKNTPVNHVKTPAELDDEALFKNNANPNEGIGYVAPKSGSAADTTKQDRELRRRMLGRRGQEMVAERERLQRLKKKKQQLLMEESEDEDAGRSALGKRKRPRREVPPLSGDNEDGKEQLENGEDEENHEDKERHEDEEKREVGGAESAATEQTAQSATTTTTTKRRKNKKKKNKSKA